MLPFDTKKKMWKWYRILIKVFIFLKKDVLKVYFTLIYRRKKYEVILGPTEKCFKWERLCISVNISELCKFLKSNKLIIFRIEFINQNIWVFSVVPENFNFVSCLIMHVHQRCIWILRLITNNSFWIWICNIK